MATVCSVGPKNFGGAAADDFEAIGVSRVGSQDVAAEAGAWIINLDQRDRATGVVDDSGGNVRGFAACEGEESDREWDENTSCWSKAHVFSVAVCGKADSLAGMTARKTKVKADRLSVSRYEFRVACNSKFLARRLEFALVE